MFCLWFLCLSSQRSVTFRRVEADQDCWEKVGGSTESQVAVPHSPIWEDEGGMWAAHVGCLEVCTTSFRLHFLLCAIRHHLSGRIGVALSSKTEHTLRLFLRQDLTGWVALPRLKGGVMNLYRSFGCLLETWVAEGYPVERSSSAEGWGKNVDPNGSDSASADSLRLTGAALRSESEDSGVELPSLVSPLTSQNHVLISQASQLGQDDLRPSCSSPALSQCSSSSSYSSAINKGSFKQSETAVLKVEEALRRTEPAWRSSVDGSLRRRCNTTSISSGSRTPSIRSRVGSVGPGRPYKQPVDEQRSPEPPRVTHMPQQPADSNKEPEAVIIILIYITLHLQL